MFKTLFGRNPASSSHSNTQSARLRALEGSASADKAAAMLIGPTALMQLSHDEARIVVSYMRPHRIDQGTIFIREGDVDKTDFMLLVLDGEVTVETIVVSRSEPITLTVLGPGRVIGEMGLLDGEPRAASCTATTDVHGAILTRAALGKLMDDDPRTAAKLMMAISLRMAVRLRESTDKLKMYTQLTQAMQQEINQPTV